MRWPLAAAAAAAAFLAPDVGFGQARTLTVVSWGGAYTKSQVEAYHKPFTAKTGIAIKPEDYDGNVAPIRSQVRSGRVFWDVVDVEHADAVRLCEEGLLERIDIASLPPGRDGKPAQDDFIKGTYTDCAVATVLWSTIYGYDRSRITGAPPRTIADFFDLKRFPGKRGLRKVAKDNLEMALMADGVPPADVYKTLRTTEGVERAFRKLDTIRHEIVWWTVGAEPPQMLGDGRVVMATAYNGRIFDAAQKDKKPFEIVWDGQIWDIDLWAIPKGAPNRDAALEFVKFSTSTEALAEQAKWISYAPARRSSIPLVAKSSDGKIDMGPHMPTAPGNFRNALQSDFRFWAEKQDDIARQFNRWLAK